MEKTLARGERTSKNEAQVDIGTIVENNCLRVRGAIFMKRLLWHLLQPRSIILGFTVYYFSWACLVWSREPVGAFHREMFVATMFLISAIGLTTNRVWSNLLAAVISGQLPFAFLTEFWMLSKNAEVTTFSLQHLKTWFWIMFNAGSTAILWLAFSLVVLVYSAVSITHSATVREDTNL